MRFRWTEYAPSNKRQYVMSISLRDLEIMHALAANADRAMPKIPSNPQYEEVRTRLASMAKAMTAALVEADRLEDDGNRRLPWGKRRDEGEWTL